MWVMRAALGQRTYNHNTELDMPCITSASMVLPMMAPFANISSSEFEFTGPRSYPT